MENLERIYFNTFSLRKLSLSLLVVSTDDCEKWHRIEEKISNISMTPSIEIKVSSFLRLVFGHRAIYQHRQIR